MKQQFVVSIQYTVLHMSEDTWPILNTPTLMHVMFLQKYRTSNFCVYNTLTEGVFVTQLSSYAGMSV
jgi:hypothetical protein